MVCSVADCTKQARSRTSGICSMHRRRIQRHGTTDSMSVPRTGLRFHPLRRAWKSMKTRCYSPNSVTYKSHGARGIEVCDRWLGPDGLQNFIMDMGPRPDGTSLDRINNDGNYEPENCRWATRIEQRFNQSDVHLSIKDIQQIRDSKEKANDLAERYHLTRKTIGRIKSGKSWSNENLKILEGATAMKAIFEVEFDPKLMADDESVKEMGGWLEMMKWLIKENSVLDIVDIDETNLIRIEE